MNISPLVVLVTFAVSANSDERHREKRFLTFTDDSATGVLVAIAVPIELRYRNVFLSYNFEANYGMPVEPADYIPGPLERLEILDRGLGREISGETNKSEIVKSQQKRSSGAFFTRKKIYKTLESYLQCHGHRGRACLLRTICEASQDPIHEHNGLFGDIVHIILTPSTSMREDLHPEYYIAEELGLSGNCSKYTKHCPQNIIDYISRVFLS